MRNFITELTQIYNHIARATPPTPSVNHYHFQGVVRMSTVSVREQSEGSATQMPFRARAWMIPQWLRL